MIIEGDLTTGGFKMAAGAEANKVLTTNASGVATWQTPAGGSLWTQTGDDIYYNDGNVGIGTIDPGAKLEISGPNLTKLVAFPGQWTLSYKNDGTASPYGFNTIINPPPYEDSLYLTSLEGASHQAFYFGDGDPANNIFGISQQQSDGPWMPRFVVNQNGNVGIGTATPGEKLDVKGTLRLSGSTSGHVDLAPAPAAGSTTYTLPTTDGTYGQVLSTDGSGTLSWSTIPFSCGTSFTVTHTAGTVAPITKTVVYNTVLTSLTGSPKCWITQNLGADNQASSYDDGTEPSAGWYWQFNRQQGYKYDSTLSPAWSITSINEDSNWIVTNDPCAILLGAGWRLPTSAEWANADANGLWDFAADVYDSVLKLHKSGRLLAETGQLTTRGYGSGTGRIWSSTQGSAILGGSLYTTSTSCEPLNSDKARGYSVRCLRD